MSGWLIGRMQDLIYYDELLHAVSAVRMMHGECIQEQVSQGSASQLVSEKAELQLSHCYHGESFEVLGHTIVDHRVPMWVLYYVGAIKTYVLAGWFALFGISVDSLRWFSVSCGGLVLGTVFVLLRRYAGSVAAMIGGLLLISDPTWMLSRILDWGPVGVQDVLKVVLVWVSLRIFFERVSWRWYGIFGLLSGVMMWEKLNAWWVAVPLWGIILIKAVIPAFTLFRVKAGNYCEKYQEASIKYQENHQDSMINSQTITNNQLSRSMLIALCVGLLIGLVPIFLLWWKRPWFYTESQKSFVAFEEYALINRGNDVVWNLLQSYVSDWGLRAETVWKVLRGSAIPEYVLRGEFPFVYGGGVVLLFCFCHRWNNRLLKLLVFLIVSILLLLFLTPHANGIHHVLMVFPLVQMLVAVVMSELWVKRKWLVSALLICLLLNGWLVLAQFVQRVQDERKVEVYWRRGMYRELTERLERDYGGKDIVALDWGISLPVSFLSEGSVRIRDLQPFYEVKCEVVKEMKDRDVVMVKYVQDERVFGTYYGEECGWVW